MRRTLDIQADRIEWVLASHRIRARVRGGRITPRGVCFEVLTPLGTRVSRIAALHEELALVLGAPNVTVRRRGGIIEVVVPRDERRRVPIERLLARVRQRGKVPRVTALLGLDDEGDPLLLRLSSPDVVHALIAGTTGSGKTMLMRTMALTLALWNRQKDVQLVLIDPKSRGLAPLVGLPHVWGPLCARIEDILAMLKALISLMERRDREKTARPHMVVFIDELAEVLMLGGGWAQEMLTRLVQRGREAGIHIVAATQKPTARVLGSLMKGNFPVRIVGRVASVDDARVAAGIGGSGAEKLRGHGEFLLVAQGAVVPFLAPYLDGEALARLVSQVEEGPMPAPRPRRLPTVPRADNEESEGKNTPPQRTKARGNGAVQPHSTHKAPSPSDKARSMPRSVTPAMFTPWAWEVGQGANGKSEGMAHDTGRTTYDGRRNTYTLAAQMVAVWEQAGKQLSLSATLSRLGRKPGGSLWHTYAAAYKEAAAAWNSSSPSSSRSSQPRLEGKEVRKKKEK